MTFLSGETLGFTLIYVEISINFFKSYDFDVCQYWKETFPLISNQKLET